MNRYLVLALTVAFPMGVHAQPPAPPVSGPVLILNERQSKVVPHRAGFTHTGGGNIDVAQPAPDTIVVTMTGVAVAGAHPCKDSVASQAFDLAQCFEVSLEKSEGKKLKLQVSARVIGLLRSHQHSRGVAEESGGATISSGPTALVSVSAPSHSVSCGQSLSINDQEGPINVPVLPGKLTLHQVFHVAARHPRSLLPCKAASAEFAPDPALDPLWISYWEPFHGAIKKDFGFQVVIKVIVD